MAAQEDNEMMFSDARILRILGFACALMIPVDIYMAKEYARRQGKAATILYILWGCEQAAMAALCWRLAFS